MSQDEPDDGVPLRALPLQYIEVPEGVVLKRGRHEVLIGGARVVEAVQTVLGLAADGGASRRQIVDHFAAPDRPDILKLVTQLEQRRFLVPADDPGPTPLAQEGPLDVFYWHFGTTVAAVRGRLTDPIAIVGVNCISRQLAGALMGAGFSQVEVVQYPQLSNLRLYGSDGEVQSSEWPDSLPAPIDYGIWRGRREEDRAGCIVATSDFGGMTLMRPWNEHCVKTGRNFLPVVLQDLIGHVGPLVVPGETACFECLRARQNANMPDPALKRAPEEQAYIWQATTGFHPSMASILGDLAAMELSRFYGGLGQPRLAGALIEVNLLAPTLQVRKVLKAPRCPVCSPLNAHAPVSADRNVFLPGNEWHE